MASSVTAGGWYKDDTSPGSVRDFTFSFQRLIAGPEVHSSPPLPLHLKVIMLSATTLK